MNQEKKIIEYLRTNTEITTLAAFQTFKITRLAARIKDIKNRYGDDAILDRWMQTPNATVKAYRLSPAFKAMLDVKKPIFPSERVFKPNKITTLDKIMYSRSHYDRRTLPLLFFTQDYSIKNIHLFLKGEEYPPYMFNYDRMIDLMNEGVLTSQKTKT